MNQFEYRELAKDCLLVNKTKLGINEELIPKILHELNDKHEINVWETEWLTYSDKWVYLELQCLDNKQKENLWSLVAELLVYFGSLSQPITKSRQLLAELKMLCP